MRGRRGRTGRRGAVASLAVALALTVGWVPAPGHEVAPRTTAALGSTLEPLLEPVTAPIVETVASVVDDLPDVGSVAVPLSSAVAFELPAGLDQLWVRADGPAGPTPWTLLELVDPADGPDGARAEARRVTELAWVRAADRIEVLAPAGDTLDEVRVHLTDTLGLRQALAEGQDALDDLLADVLTPLDDLEDVAAELLAPLDDVDEAVAELLAPDEPDAPPPPAAAPEPRRASSARPAIVRRADWGAASPRSSHGRARPRAVVVHHTATRNDYTPRESPAIVRAIQHHHQRTMGWSDVGYNLLIDRFGRVFEGRAGGIEAGVVGAHARGYNTGTYGVSLIGNYDAAEPPRTMLDRLADVTAWQARVHGIDLRSGARTTVNGTTIRTFLGHRDVGQTACPGRYVVRRMDQVRQAAAAARR